jgi:hypothetical protein
MGSGYSPDWFGNGGRGLYEQADNCPMAVANFNGECTAC